MTKLAAIAAAALLVLTGVAEARGTSTPSSVPLDRRGRIARSAEVKDAFKRANPCPSTGKSSGACPGYVIDHVNPLKRGGPDTPSNMQWQTIEESKAKDKIE